MRSLFRSIAHCRENSDLQEYVKNMKARGLPGDEALKFCREWLKKNPWSSSSPPDSGRASRSSGGIQTASHA